MVELGIYQPQIPQNTGTLLRMSSCLGVHLNIIGPMNFIFTDSKMKRAGMDYIDSASYDLFSSFEVFHSEKHGHRLVALEISPMSVNHTDFSFSDRDILIVGSEHSGFEDRHLSVMDEMVKVPMIPGRRSLNMAMSMAFVLGEAIRQLGAFKEMEIK